MAARRRRGTRSPRDRINPGHDQVRAVLRFVGPGLVFAGIIVILSGCGMEDAAPDFFDDSDAHMRASQKAMGYYMAGSVLIMLGVGMTRFAFQGALARFHAAEKAPVIADTANYVVDSTKDSVKTAVGAIADGIREGKGEGDRKVVVRCHKCNKDNDENAKFCNACGAALAKSAACPSCGEKNDPDANFCDNCGGRIG